MPTLFTQKNGLPISQACNQSISNYSQYFRLATSFLILLIGLSWVTHTMAGEFNYSLESARNNYMSAQLRLVDTISKPEMNNEASNRNLVKYLAKVELAERNLFATETKYLTELEAAVLKKTNFIDFDYKKNSKLDAAVKEYNLIRLEVGQQTIIEAIKAFPDEEMLGKL